MPNMVPDRGGDPRRHVWDVHNFNTGAYQYSFYGGKNLRQTTKNKHFGPDLANEIVRGGHDVFRVDPKKRKFKK